MTGFSGSIARTTSGPVIDELNALLEEAGKRGFLWHLFRSNQHGPDVLAGVFQWPDCADVFVLTDERHAHAYRMPTGPHSDVYVPGEVFWWYQSSPVWTLRAVLTLPEPDHPDTPTALAAAPPGSGIPGDRVPVRIRRRGT
jgi:hypothetical protein